MATAPLAQQGGARRDGSPSAKGKSRSYTFHAYIRRRHSDGKYVAVCLRPYLVAEGKSLGEAKQMLLQLLDGYIHDAVKDGTLDLFLRRRAPLLDYARCGLSWFAQWISQSCKPFTKTCCIPQHA
jgi:predicted RNase H-like HicB family nuclease